MGLLKRKPKITATTEEEEIILKMRGEKELEEAEKKLQDMRKQQEDSELVNDVVVESKESKNGFFDEVYRLVGAYSETMTKTEIMVNLEMLKWELFKEELSK